MECSLAVEQSATLSATPNLVITRVVPSFHGSYTFPHPTDRKDRRDPCAILHQYPARARCIHEIGQHNSTSSGNSYEPHQFQHLRCALKLCAPNIYYSEHVIAQPCHCAQAFNSRPISFSWRRFQGYSRVKPVNPSRVNPRQLGNYGLHRRADKPPSGYGPTIPNGTKSLVWRNHFPFRELWPRLRSNRLPDHICKR
jgi:hypothetical protein